MPCLKIFRSCLSYYFNSCISYSRIRIRSIISTLLSCRLCLLHFVNCIRMLISCWCIHRKRPFTFTLSILMTWTCSIFFISHIKLLHLLKFRTFCRHYDISWFFIRTWRFYRLVMRTKIRIVTITVLVLILLVSTPVLWPHDLVI